MSDPRNILIVGNHRALTSLAKDQVDKGDNVWFFAERGISVYDDTRDVDRWCQGDPADDVAVLDLVNKLMAQDVVLSDIILGHCPIKIVNPMSATIMELSALYSLLVAAPAVLLSRLKTFDVMRKIGSTKVSLCGISPDYLRTVTDHHLTRLSLMEMSENCHDLLKILSRDGEEYLFASALRWLNTTDFSMLTKRFHGF